MEVLPRTLLAFHGILLFSAGTGLHELMLDPPGRTITFSQLALERKGGKVVLGLADKVDGEEPVGQRELGARKEGSGDQ